MKDNAPQMLKPTLIAGLPFGAAAAIPFVGILNCCTICGFVWGGGLLAAYLYSSKCKEAGVPFGAGAGATVGLITGAFFALAYSIVSALFALILPAMDVDQILEMIQDQGQEVPPEAIELLDKFAAAGPILMAIIVFFIWLIIGAVFSTIGGLIGGAVFKHEPAPPASGDIPPEA